MNRFARFMRLIAGGMAFLVMTLFAIQCGVNIFSDADDIRLGQQLDQEIHNNSKDYPILQNHPEVKAYVKSVGDRILASPQVTKRGVYAYQYEIIHDDKTINAFCTPGGYIYVYTGLLKFIDNEATLAGVLGHEIAHAERRHATKRMTKQYGAQVLISMILGKNPGKIAEISTNLFSGLALLANSRSDETESDEYSLKYLSTSPYYPGGVTYFFQKIQTDKSSRGGALERFLSTHPLPQDRIDHVNEILRSMGNVQAAESNLFAQRFQTIKSKLP